MIDPSEPAVPRAIHPWPVRLLHAVNAMAIVVMTGSGLMIHNAFPIMPFAFPGWLTIGGDLTTALRWHLAAMWVFGATLALALPLGLASGRFARRLLPVSARGVWRDLRAALSGRLTHDDPAACNQIQRLFYLGVMAVGVLAVLSGLALWKPVQFGWLCALLGDFAIARRVHFACMALITGFTVIHVAMALLVPRTIVRMILGGSR